MACDHITEAASPGLLRGSEAILHQAATRFVDISGL